MKAPSICASLSILFLTIFFANALFAQTTTSGSLTGVVTDQSGAAVSNAVVEINDNSKGIFQSIKTDRDGVYRFFFLAPSTYKLTVMHDGFRIESRTVNVVAGAPGTVNVMLEVAKTSSEITVSGEAPLIQTENGDISSTMNRQQIADVPNPGNDLTYIAQTAPGVVMNTDSQSTGGIQNGAPNFSMLGMPGSSYHYTMDGMSITGNAQNFIVGGSLGLSLGQNQIEEATVISTGFSSQFGDAAGGNINYITKSGSNRFHGNAQYYWNGRVLNANDWFNKAFDKPRPFSIANQWAGSFGGPIRKDKLFFFFDTEGLRLLIPQIFTVTIPSPEFEAATIANIDSRFGSTSASDAFYKRIFNLYNATPGAQGAIPGGFGPGNLGCAGFVDPNNPNGPGHGNVPCAVHFIKTRGRPSQDALTSGRLDWNVGKNDRAFFRIQGESGRGAFFTDPISSVFDADYDVSLWEWQFVETHTFGSAAASQFLLSGFSYSSYWKVRDPSQALGAFPTVLNFNVPGTFTNLGGADFIGSYGCYCTQLQVSEDLQKIRGSHKLGFGAEIIRGYWSSPRNTVNAVGQLFPQTLDAFYQGGIDPAAPTVDFTSLTQSFTSQPSVHVSVLNFAAYGQDEWHAQPNLTFTLGLRAEHYSNPLCRTRCFSRAGGPFESINHDPNQPYNQAILTNQRHALLGLDSILWSPRFSFAWQPFGVSHNGVLRGGVAIFYDPLRAGIAEEFYINAPIYNAYMALAGNLTPDETTSLFKQTASSNAAFVNGFVAGETLSEIQATSPDFSPPALNAAERKTHLPQYQRWSLVWQQAIGGKTSVSIGYFGHHGIHELVVNPSANAYCDPSKAILPLGGPNPCFGFTSSLPLAVPDPRFSKVTQDNSNAISNYSGVVLSFRRPITRLGQGLIEVNYTYGHAFDEVSNGGFFSFTSGSSLFPQDPNNLRGAYGPAEYDVRHSLNANYVWEVPVKKALRGHGSDYFVKGWQVSGTIFARTGFPYTVFDFAESTSLQQNNYFGMIYAIPVGPLGPTPACGEGAAATNPVNPCLPAQFLTQADGTTVPNSNGLFVQAGCETGFNTGHLGASGICDGQAVSLTQGRNRFRGPGYFNTDLAIMKDTRIPGWENATLGIGLQFFNLFNHPNFGFPDNFSSDPTFGQIFYLEQSPTSILGSGLGGDAAPRMIQVKAQIRF